MSAKTVLPPSAFASKVDDANLTTLELDIARGVVEAAPGAVGGMKEHPELEI